MSALASHGERTQAHVQPDVRHYFQRHDCIHFCLVALCRGFPVSGFVGLLTQWAIGADNRGAKVLVVLVSNHAQLHSQPRNSHSNLV